MYDKLRSDITIEEINKKNHVENLHEVQLSQNSDYITG